MNLGVQYYRAPFPDSRHWEEDFKKIRQSGLNTVQLWVSWGWVEATPDQFVYDDYDRLVELAAKHHLGVVLSTIAEIQPNWIHRVIPGSEMIDHLGHKVISSARCEHHFGITPGGCTDNPQVWERMAQFIENTGRRYAGLDHLRGWDIWNELRWNVQADAIVCFCPHTLAAFRRWLETQFGSLDGLNEAWKRRYVSWEDVMPGKLPDRPYTELMAFQHFITCRANEHAIKRYQLMKAIDHTHPVTAHGANPSALYTGWSDTYPIDRGNDWFMAETLDGIGCSSFPQWSNIDDADFGIRIDMVKSAANGKKVWLSELQGGRASTGFNVYGVVRADLQQRWIWNGLASGADTVLFWCWRDEVFGRESAGFGLSGRDGYAEERLAAMKVTGDLWKTHESLFDHYLPDRAEVGLLFTPQSHYLDWAQEASAERICDALTGYARALTKCSIPLIVVEAEHLAALDQLKVLILPRSLVLDAPQEEAIRRFVERGGTLIAESETGAFDRFGFYRYPEERFLTQFGIVEIGRRELTGDTGTFRFNHRNYQLGLEQWATPPEGAAPEEFGVTRSYGKGKIVYLGSYPGSAYRHKWNQEFESLLQAIVLDAGVELPVIVQEPKPQQDSFVYLKSGKSNGKTLLFVFFPPDGKTAEITVADHLFPQGVAKELFSNTTVKLTATPGRRTMQLTPGRYQLAVYTD